ncbi:MULTISPECIES: hypothetical protein [Levilactobacillus]|uniref:Uncharacterized protein n=1 Tax=Levilactobacillus fujinensis TaxID=2486024 RepID=A0ABW1TJ23_9LACO|nr:MULTISPECIES: hypothetical protein [Levilactobacillus]
MKKYLVINEFTRPDVADKAFTKTMVVDADDANGALLQVAHDALFNKNGDKWDMAANDGRLDQSTVGIYELVSGENELPAMVE